MKNKNILFDYLRNSSRLIDKNIHLYLICLFNYIFLKQDKLEYSRKFENYLKSSTERINKKIIKLKNKYINLNLENIYSINNFNNIIYFVNIQNKKFAGEIIEGILMIIFSKVMKVYKDKTFGKYIFNNIHKLKDPYNYEIAEWFKNAPNKFRNEELQNFNNLLSLDSSNDEQSRYNISIIKFQKESPFFNLLIEIYTYKYIFLTEEFINNKTKYYINKGEFNNQSMRQKIFGSLEETQMTIIYDIISNFKSNSNSTLINSHYYSKYFKNIRNSKKVPFNLMRSFFISVFIYYQNKNSPLMKYIPQKEGKNIYIEFNESELVNIPFEYDLKGAGIEGKYSNIILCPLRIEPRISKINISKNNLMEIGLFEMSKVLLFNKNIKKLECSISLLRSYFLDYFNLGLGLFDNYNIEELNLSFNYIKEDSEPFLSKFICHLKGLKTLNLSSTDLKGGASYMFIMLRKLYRKRKMKLENLFLNKCNLDNTSYYELGELLKSKYCKLKRLYLSINNCPNNFNFLKKIKINKFLEEIIFTKSYYGNNDVDDINRIINCANLKNLYLSNNKINNFNKCLSIIYRTKLINEKKLKIRNKENKKNSENENSKNNIKNREDEIEIIKNRNKDIIIGNFGVLHNLDLSYNDAWIINKKQVNLIHKLINETTLSCLDISHILLGSNPDKSLHNDFFKNNVLKIKTNLEKSKKIYRRIYGEKERNKVDINKLKYLEEEDIFKEIQKNKNLKNEIDKKIEEKDAIYPVFLMKNAIKIIEKINENIQYKDIKDNIQLTNDKKSENYKSFINNLANYMKLKKAEKELINNYKELDKKKLILI